MCAGTRCRSTLVSVTQEILTQFLESHFPVEPEELFKKEVDIDGVMELQALAEDTINCRAAKVCQSQRLEESRKCTRPLRTVVREGSRGYPGRGLSGRSIRHWPQRHPQNEYWAGGARGGPPWVCVRKPRRTNEVLSTAPCVMQRWGGGAFIGH